MPSSFCFCPYICMQFFAMSNVALNSALDPLAPLQRWISYTQIEVLRIKEDVMCDKLTKKKRTFDNYNNVSWMLLLHSCEKVNRDLQR